MSRYNNRNNNFNNQQQQQHERPNYFLGLKVCKPDIHQKLVNIQNHITSVHPNLSRSSIPSQKLHLTVFVMNLKSEDEIQLVKSTLLPQIKTILSDIEFVNFNPPSVNIKGIGQFNQRVIWAGLSEDQNKALLGTFVQRITKLFKDNNIQLEDRWSPHITLFKGQRSIDFERAIGICERSFSDTDFGIQEFSQLDFMKIGSLDKTTGYYRIEDSISFI
eukprot:gene3707-4619_t